MQKDSGPVKEMSLREEILEYYKGHSLDDMITCRENTNRVLEIFEKRIDECKSIEDVKEMLKE